MEGTTCYVHDKKEWIEAEYLGLFQYSTVLDPSPMIGGHKGGVIAYPVAVVKVNNKIQDFSISKVRFSRD